MVRQLSVTAIAVVLFVRAIHAMPSFFGAEGSGANSAGGRGGRVIEVTNLNDDGAGSFRAACAAQGPRIVVFKVGGIIDVESEIQITNPFITIAGQTAPGGGILLRGTLMDNTPVYIYTHDVVIRYIRIRTGKGETSVSQEGDCIGMGKTSCQCYNIVIDHCSFSWCNDEMMEIWVNNGTGGSILRNITFSNTIFAEGLNFNNHGYGPLAGSNYLCESVTGIDFHHNLFMSNVGRNPTAKIASLRLINNIVYNYSWGATQIQGGMKSDIVNNVYRLGPSTTTRNEIICSIDAGATDCYNYGVPGLPSIYLTGNIGPNNTNPDADGWNSMMELTVNGWEYSGRDVDPVCKRLAPLPYDAGVPITLRNAPGLDSALLPMVGANVRLDSLGRWTPCRDAVDERLVREYWAGAGTIQTDENTAGGYPSIAAGTAYADGDHDGMADAWERANILNPASPTDGNQDADSDGYTNIEEFLNATNPRNGTTTATSIPAVGMPDRSGSASSGLYSIDGRAITPGTSVNGCAVQVRSGYGMRRVIGVFVKHGGH